MVTLNMESRSPMGRVNAENRSKMQKPLGFKGLKAAKSQEKSTTLGLLDNSFFAGLLFQFFFFSWQRKSDKKLG